MTVLQLVSICFVVFCVAFAGTALMRFLCPVLGWMAEPRSDRWHNRPVALCGGIGFFPAFFGGTTYVLIQSQQTPWTVEWRAFFETGSPGTLSVALLAGATIMFVIGAIDDRWNLSPSTKLAGQLLASTVFIFAGGIFPLTSFVVVNLIVTWFWFVGVINAVNLLDNMDGLASGIILVGGMTLAVLAWNSDGTMPLAIPLAVILTGTMFGFWFHNRPPAAIFMGDSGSLFAGYVLAALAIPTTLNAGLNLPEDGIARSVLSIVVPATALAVPIFDTALVTISRKLSARNVFIGGTDHSSHRLVTLGVPERKAVSTLYILSVFGGAVAVFVQHFPNQSIPILGFFSFVLVSTGLYLGQKKVHATVSEPTPSIHTPRLWRGLHSWRAAEVLLDAVIAAVCFYAAYLLRFDGALDRSTRAAVLETLPLVVMCCLLAFSVFGIYRSQWRLISISDLRFYVGGVLGGTALSLAAVTLLTRFEQGNSRSAYLIFAPLLFLALVASRSSFRVIDALLSSARSDQTDGRIGVLIYGAGKGGKLLCEEIGSGSKMRTYAVRGFIDDDLHRVDRMLCGLPVKTPDAWLSSPMQRPFEIWISSAAIPAERALNLADRFGEHTAVGRMRWDIVSVSRSSNPENS